ncbi:putative mfs transporter protein [Phaeoacremonium minimum UCRPA7]|uniref:Putative mfs transporter protein n=1 Tax=Phaeoacremonium minimum (strain UCR-PA7) TaxID=1286976 RepID=R8BWR1_PHAM7|nr:putative mfs transporter protein [Phaeoacremonium minimum UCRPA7]EOO03739.1 putative mfs transporter protein [Phaeoacremonium minimum UCRPA7]
MAEENKGIVHRCLEELGLKSLYHSSRDIKLLCLQRFVRLFAYGASTLVLVAFLEGLGHSKTKIGLFMTLTLWGDVCISFVLTLFADGLGRKAILAVGAALMAASGVIFGLFGNYWILLAAAVFGVISPAGNEIGPFRAIEESVVGHLTSSAHRSDIYAWYSLLGTAGAAFGVMTGGWVVHYLMTSRHWEELEAYRIIFYGYAALGVVKLLLALMLSGAIEAEKKQQKLSTSNAETAPLLGESNADGNSAAVAEQPEVEPKRGIRALLPEISKESWSILISLCLLFAVDSFASGLASL